MPNTLYILIGSQTIPIPRGILSLEYNHHGGLCVKKKSNVEFWEVESLINNHL